MGTNQTEIIRAQLVAEFVDDALADSTGCVDSIPRDTEIVRARFVETIVENEAPLSKREFIVVWKAVDRPCCRVRGDGLDMILDQASNQKSHYGIWINEGGSKTLVGLFGASDVAGIYEGSFEPVATNVTSVL